MIKKGTDELSYKNIDQAPLEEFKMETIIHWYISDYHEEPTFVLHDVLMNSNYTLAGEWLTSFDKKVIGTL